MKHGERSRLERSDVEGYDLDPHNRGDGIRAWYSGGVRFVDNRMHNARDVILWFSNDALIEGNEISGGRYGLHFTYDDGMVVRGNEVYDNSVGVFLMYSSNVSVHENLIRDSYGPSGYGLGLLPVHGFLGHLIGAGCPGRGGVHDQLRTGIERA